MKKLSVALTMVTLLAGGYCLPTNATGLAPRATTLKALYPDSPDFAQGRSDGHDFDAAVLADNGGVKTSAYYQTVDDEIAMAQQNTLNSPNGSAEYYYWWGYRIGLQQAR